MPITYAWAHIWAMSQVGGEYAEKAAHDLKEEPLREADEAFNDKKVFVEDEEEADGARAGTGQYVRFNLQCQISNSSKYCLC